MVFRSNFVSPKILILTVILGQFWGTISEAHSLRLHGRRKFIFSVENGKITDFSEKIHSIAAAKSTASSPSEKEKRGPWIKKHFKGKRQKFPLKIPLRE
jgi:hypothetical protein